MTKETPDRRRAAATHLALHPDTIVIPNEGFLTFVRQKRLKIEMADKVWLGIVKKLRAGIAYEAISRLPAKSRQLVSALGQSGFLVRKTPSAEMSDADLSSRTVSWMSFRGIDSDDYLSRMAESHVVIVGCGGTGSHIAAQFAAAGVGALTLIDAAQLNLSDLNRQYLYTRADIGRAKVSALKERLAERYPETSVDAHVARIDDGEQIERLLGSKACMRTPNLIVCAADSPPLVINHACAIAAKNIGCALLEGSVGFEELSIGPLSKHETELDDRIDGLRAQLETVQRLGLEDLNKTISGSLPTTNTEAASKIAHLGVCFLAGTTEVE